MIPSGIIVGCGFERTNSTGCGKGVLMEDDGFLRV